MRAVWARLLAERGRAPDTVRIYVGALERWLGYPREPLAPEPAEIAAWVRDRRRALAVGTFNLELTALRAFYRFAHAAGYTPEDYGRRFPQSHRAPKRLPRTLEPEAIARLLAAPDLGTWRGFRDHVMLRLLAETGIRAGELVRLTLGDVLKDRMLHVNGRFIPLSAEMHALLSEWIRLRRQARPGKAAVLFVTSAGRHFTRARAVWALVARYARPALGVGRAYRRVHASRPWSGPSPQRLRAAFAQAALARGLDLRAVQTLLGHADIATTARYLGLDLERLKREHAKLPRARALRAAES